MRNYHSLISLTIEVVGITTLLSSCGSPPTAIPDELFNATDTLISISPEIMRAETELNMQCLRYQGLDAPENLPFVDFPQEVADIGGVYRSQEEALRTGYTTTLKGEDPNNPLTLFLSQLTDREKELYDSFSIPDSEVMGTEEDTTCPAQATRILFGSFEAGNTIMNTYNDYAAHQTKNTVEIKEVQDSLSKYMECLGDLGYKVTPRLEMKNIAEEDFGHYRSAGEGPNQDEQAMVLDDYTCQEKADLLTTVQNAL